VERDPSESGRFRVLHARWSRCAPAD
jgi:hypothetical protein